MAREVTYIELEGVLRNGNPRRYECASDTDIAIDTVLKLNDDRTATTSTGTGDPFAGVSDMDKDATDGSTSIGAYQKGIFEFTASGAIIVGQKVKTAAPGNYVMAAVNADVTSSYAIIVGVAQKTVADGARVQVRVNN